MSVNAINAADPQQKNSPVGSAVATGVGLGLAGAAGGYFLGGKRPDLEKVFAMPADKFDPQVKEAAEDLKADVEKIKNARAEYAAAGAAERETLGQKIMARAGFINNESKVAPENLAELKTKVSETKAALDGKKVKVGDADKTFAELKSEVNAKRKAWIEAKNEYAAAAEGDAKTAAKTKLDKALEELNKAKEDRKAFYNGAKDEVNNYIKAERDLVKAKVAKYDAIKGEGEAKSISEAVTEASNKFKEVKKTKLTELTGKQEIKDAFAKIQKLFAKEGKGKAAMIYGGIAAAVGLIAGYIFGSKEA